VKRLLLGAPFLGLLLAPACAADPLFVEETDVIATVHDEEANFSSFKTYSLPNVLPDLCFQPTSGDPSADAYGGAGGDGFIESEECFETDHDSDAAILDALAENMEALGYERVDDSDSADVVLLAALISRGSWAMNRAYCYPSDFYRGCVSPLSNEPVFVRTGTLLLQLIDAKKSSGEDLFTTWTAAIQQTEALRASKGSEAVDAVMSRAIDQAFAQSVYLGGE
jgi:hypothetical protein